MAKDTSGETAHYYMLYYGTGKYILVHRNERLVDQLERAQGIFYLRYTTGSDAKTVADRRLQAIQSIQRSLSRRQSSGGAYG